MSNTRVDYEAVVAATEVIAIGRAGVKLDGLQDLRGRTVGMLRGTDYGAEIGRAHV